MKQTIYQIDAFTKNIFGGNPAAVCILESWIDVKTMQQISAENNLSETAFAVKTNNKFEIRWFTPSVEIDLCGHATLAAAYVLFNYFHITDNQIQFYSHRSGNLSVEKERNGNLILDFPTNKAKEVDQNLLLNKAIGKTPIATLKSEDDYLLIYESQKEIEDIKPDLSALSKIKTRGVMVSSIGDTVDFVSRFFAPAAGIDEDPVTGSAHCTLTPYWSDRLVKTKLSAKQLSKRGGDLNCELVGDRVKISGYCALYLIGEIYF